MDHLDVAYTISISTGNVQSRGFHFMHLGSMISNQLAHDNVCQKTELIQG